MSKSVSYSRSLKLSPGRCVLTLGLVLATSAASQALDGSFSVKPSIVANSPPANDAFALRQPIAEFPFQIRADNHGATAETGEPHHGEGLPAYSLWWTWTAPADGFVRISNDWMVRPTVRFYSGTTLSELNVLEQKVVEPRFQGWLTFEWVRVESNVVYQIAVDCAVPRAINIGFEFFSTPSNDQFANRIELPATSVSCTNQILGATLEVGEPKPAEANNGATIWFTWVAPVDGLFHLNSPYYWASFAVYSGNSFSNLARLSAPLETISRALSIRVEGGKAYQISLCRWNQFDSYFYDDGMIEWSASFEAAPSNDHFEHRTLLAGNSGEFEADGRLAVDNRVWYEWIAPTNGTLLLGGAAPYFGDNPAHLVSLDNQFPGISVTQGMSIKLSVFAPSPTRISYHFYDLPTNDFFASAQRFTGNSVRLAGHNYGAGHENGEPRLGPGRSIWYTWTAPTNGWATWHVWTLWYSSARIYEGTALSRLKPVTYQSQVRSPEGVFTLDGFRATAGKTYQFVVDNQPGTFEVEFTFTTLQLDAGLTFSSDHSPVLHAALSGGSGQSSGGITGTEFSLVYLDRFCPGISVTSNETDGALRWTNPPPGRFLILAVVTNLIGETMIVSPVTIRIPPPNDDLEHPELLSGYQFTHTAPIGGAGRQSGEPSHGAKGLGSIWWQWTAPASGWVDLGLTIYGHRMGFEPGTPGTDLLPAMAVYRFGNGKLQRVVGAKRKSFKATTRFQAERDVTYLIAGQMPPQHYLSDCAGSAELALNLAAARMAPQLAGQTFVHRTPIVLAVEPNFSLEEIDRVDYFESDASSRPQTFLTGTNQSPFLATWFGATKGPHQIVARVYRKDGASFVTDSVRFFVRTANDNFADATLLLGEAPVIQDDVAYATRERGEPRETGAPYGDSVWYVWTAPRSGKCLVRLIGFGEAVYFYTGSSVSRSERVAAQRNDAATLYWFDSIAGTTYHIAVKRNVLWPVPFELSILPGDSPANDAFSQAEPVAPDATHISGTLRFGTVEPGEPGGQIGSSAWFTWTTPADGVVAFKIPWPAIDLQLYAGSSLPTLQPLADLTDPRDYQWRCYRVSAQQTYRLQAYGNLAYGPNYDPYWDLNANRFNVEMRFAEPPTNDSFGNPSELPPGSTAFVGESLGASSESADVMNGLPAAPTLWWNWTAPADGTLVLTFSNLFVSVFRGDALATLQQVTGNLSPSSAEVRMNETLRLCAYHWYQYPGPFGFQLDFQQSPAGPQAENTNVTSNFSTLDASARLVVEGQSTLTQGSAVNSWTISARLLPATTLEFFVTGEPDRRFVIQSSSDLNIWQGVQPSGTTTMVAGGIHLTTELNPEAARFFRVKVIE